MKSTNNMQKKETDKPTSEQAQKKEVRRNNAPDFIPGASPYYNLYCFFINFAMAKTHPDNINRLLLFSMGNKFLLT